ncbi:MAG: hypothetical protein H6838_18515 [Planctomycetes bacterium]|nr:hypothetical protein [Planctomycetota bacterium]MCB9887491.1 hypothetical protein [Planctomycetota bacterium]
MTAEAAPVVAAPIPDRLDLLTRLSDRLNPILVREVQQAVKGRVFVLTVLGALFVNVIIALVVASNYKGGATGGRGAFDAGLATLAPLLLFIVPMQAYQSMQSELRGGMIEQLLMSELRPLRIVAGKLGAAMVQFVLYLSVLSPLLATSYLLRGVDLPTIAVCLSCALVFCVAATSFAIAAALQGMLPAMRPIAWLGMAFGLGSASLGMVGYIGSGQCLRDVGWLLRSSEFGMVTSAVLCGAIAGTALMALVAQAYLAHTFENRSTGFRVFLLLAPPLSFAWVYTFVQASHRDDVVPVATFLLSLLGIVFGIFMVSEQQKLSPRVRAHVPRNAALAACSSIFLPGRDRGMACWIAYFVLLAGLALVLWPATGRGFLNMPQSFARVSTLTLAYAAIYLTLGKWLRGRLPETVVFNHGARFLMPLLVVVGCLLPLLFDVLVIGGVDNWHFGHLLNPFWTIDRAVRDSGAAIRGLVWTLGGGCLLVQLPAMVRGLLEVTAAAAARRAQAATVAPASAVEG